MAAEITSAERINHELKLSVAMLGELADSIEQWEEMTGEEQADWSLEWDQFINILEHVLHKAYKSRQMSSEQVVRYQELLSAIRDVSPNLSKMNLLQPRVSLAEVV